MSISLTFQCRVNLVIAVIFWMKIFDMVNGPNKNNKKNLPHQWTLVLPHHLTKKIPNSTPFALPLSR